MTMINVSHGHALPNGEGCGAVGFHDESKETKAITEYLVQLLNDNGISSHDCSCNIHCDWSKCLNIIIANHNSYKNEDYSISLHLNANKDSKKDGKVKGAEVLVYSKNGDKGKIQIAERILKKLEDAGFTNRGIKERPELRFLAKCNSPSLLVELYFCDDEDDTLLAEKYGQKGLARLLAEAILDKPITDISYGTKIRVTKTLKIRNSAGADYEQIGSYLPGAVVKVLETNSKCTRAKVADGQWISLDSRYVEVIV